MSNQPQERICLASTKRLSELTEKYLSDAKNGDVYVRQLLNALEAHMRWFSERAPIPADKLAELEAEMRKEPRAFNAHIHAWADRIKKLRERIK